MQVYENVVEDPYADTGSDDETALTGVVNIYFPRMRDWMKEYITEIAEKVINIVVAHSVHVRMQNGLVQCRGTLI